MRLGWLVVVLVVLVGAAAVAQAGTVVTTSNPGGTTTEIGARIRWGATGFEASVWDNNPFKQDPTLNPGGTPVWGVGNAYAFQVTFSSITGVLDLSIDFNRDGDFGDNQEYCSKSVFVAPPTTSYVGYGFDYLSISGNEGGSTGRSILENLTINGAALPDLQPGGTFLEQFYRDSSGNPLGTITIVGDLTFLTSGTSQERPSWNFNFKDSATLVPLPAAAFIGLGMLGGLGVVRSLRRRRRSSV